MGKAKNPNTVHKTHTRPVSKTLPISSKEVNIGGVRIADTIFVGVLTRGYIERI